MTRARVLGSVGGLLGLGLLAALAVFGLDRLLALPSGPEPVAYDRVSCARCRMLVGDPAFASQLQGKNGAVAHFDDPGCLLLYLDEERPDVHAVYLHHLETEGWLTLEQAGFLEAGPTPMGYGFGAVERARPGSLDRAEVLARIRQAASAQAERRP